jgi:hypothetical protein
MTQSQTKRIKSKEMSRKPTLNETMYYCAHARVSRLSFHFVTGCDVIQISIFLVIKKTRVIVTLRLSSIVTTDTQVWLSWPRNTLALVEFKYVLPYLSESPPLVYILYHLNNICKGHSKDYSEKASGCTTGHMRPDSRQRQRLFSCLLRPKWFRVHPTY